MANDAPRWLPARVTVRGLIRHTPAGLPADFAVLDDLKAFIRIEVELQLTAAVSSNTLYSRRASEPEVWS